VLFALGPRGEVRGSVVIDSQENENRLVFSGEKIDSALPDSLFTFQVPKGANVQELR
jgi:outer membrane lipoprotein-sorting protein